MLKNNLNSKLCLLLGLMGIVLSACSESDLGSSGENERNISGFSQKGPFVKGSKVSLYEMDESLNQTGVYYYTAIDNNMGEYHLEKIPFTGRYAWMQVDGRFISELTNFESADRITLNSLVDLENRNSTNINLLGHLAFEREKHLVRNGLSIGDAKKQAESEVLNALAFGIDSTQFDQMDIFGETDADAKLLAVSVLFLLQSDVSGMFDVVDRMADFSFDIGEDGVWNNDSLKTYLAALVSASNYGSASRTFFESYKGGKVPPYEKYLDKFARSVPFYGNCSEENSIKMDVVCTMVDTIRTIHISSMIPEYEKQWECDDSMRPFICKDSIWVKYEGFLHLADASSESNIAYGEMTDRRDGRKYKTVELENSDGTKETWMAENLSYGYEEGEVDTYNHTPMYVWGEAADGHRSAQGACPEGWHIPSVEEWNGVSSDGDIGRFAENMDKLGRICLAREYYAYHETKSCFQLWVNDLSGTKAAMVGYQNSYKQGMVRYDYASDLPPKVFDADLTSLAAVRCVKDH